ncbi:MAG: vitamin B12-dependent ribonucleotide reductase [Actinobacteria bacterium]|nr:vitamin B12-dependent ribonucleotide reductase [Actinomycetota bacterium]
MQAQRISKINKRDGRTVDFEKGKIANAIEKALNATGTQDGRLAAELAKKVVLLLESKAGALPVLSVEEVQDAVERVLSEKGLYEVAKAYILYRQMRANVRSARQFVGVPVDDLKVSVNAAKVLSHRYLLKDDQGRTIETPSRLFRRVAIAVAAVEKLYDADADVKTLEEAFYNLMAGFEFIPNSPTLMNAGTSMGQLAACFVIPVEDSIPAIFDSVKHMAIIHQSGGGTGFSFSRLRPKGDLVKSTKGVASGPLSFMRVFDVATDVIKQGGRRRGANMGILRCDHPDIIEFITAKKKEGFLDNFNISVAVTDAFMEAVAAGGDIDLINPRTGETTGTAAAKELFDLIVAMAWTTGDPGLFFIDRANAANPTPDAGEFESTNPCGEIPLLPNEPCNLGSINLHKMVRGGAVDWDKLKETVRLSVRFLDNVIDAGKYPLPQIDYMAKANRKIGLGVMGFAELLLELAIAYDSEDALDIAERVMRFVYEEAIAASAELARTRGSFPNFKGSKWDAAGYEMMRNATLTTVAPTGTISIIANTSSGIEPLFAVSYAREVMEGTTLLEVDPVFEKVARERGFHSQDLMMKIAKHGTIQAMEEIPEDVRRVFVTALDIEPAWHVRIQAAFQKHVDNAVSKTVNLPENATLEDVRKVFVLAYELGCKGITAYRYGSKKEQVLYVGRPEDRKIIDQPVTAASEYSGGCPWGYCPL